MSIRQWAAHAALFTWTVTVLHAQAQTAAPTPPPATVPARAPLRLDDVLRGARENAAVTITRRALDAARADVLSADHAPAPVLTAKSSSIDLQNGIGAGSLANKRIDNSLGIDWTLERGGKRRARVDAAERAAEAAQADVDDTQVQQVIAAGNAYFDLLGAQERLAEVGEIERSAGQLASTSNRRVQAGDLAAQEASRAEIEAQRSRLETRTAELDRERARLTLAQLLGPTAPVRGADANPADWPGTGAALPEGDVDALVETRADVRAALARVAANEGRLALAEAQRSADVTLGVSIDRYPGVSNRLLEVRASIPLNWSYRFEGEIGRAQAELEQARETLAKTRHDARLELLRLRAEAENNQRRLQTFEGDILTRARKVADNAELAYRRGAMSLTDLLDARRTVRATQLDAINARVDHAKASLAWRLRTQPSLSP